MISQRTGNPPVLLGDEEVRNRTRGQERMGIASRVSKMGATDTMCMCI